MLYVAEDLGYINAETAKSLRERCMDLSIKLASFMSKLHDYDNNKNNKNNSEAVQHEIINMK